MSMTYAMQIGVMVKQKTHLFKYMRTPTQSLHISDMPALHEHTTLKPSFLTLIFSSCPMRLITKTGTLSTKGANLNNFLSVFLHTTCQYMACINTRTGGGHIMPPTCFSQIT